MFRVSFPIGTGLGCSSLYVGFIFALVGGLMSFIFLLAGGDPLGAWKLSDHGVTTTAQIVDVQRDQSTSINGVHPWLITYSFLDRNERSIQSSYRTMNSDLVMPLQAGETITIIYDPDNPDTSMPQGADPPGNFFGWFLLLPLGFFVGGLGIVAGSLWSLIHRILRRY